MKILQQKIIIHQIKNSVDGLSKMEIIEVTIKLNTEQ